MKLSEMKQLLAGRGIQLTKSLGQNFLHDGNQLRRIVAAAGLTRSDRVLEIGPGLGPLTERLIAQAGEVLAIEKDRRLVEVLKERFASAGNLHLLQADAWDHLRRTPADWSAWKVVSNLPYSVGSAILVELAQAAQPPSRIVVTVQREVANRLLARAGGADYGLLTLLVQHAYEPTGQFRVPASCFFPEPDVESSCVTLIRRARPILHAGERDTFVRVVKRSFSQRRKMMLKLLREDWPAAGLERVFAALDLSLQTRAERVSLEQFVALTKHLIRT